MYIHTLIYPIITCFLPFVYMIDWINGYRLHWKTEKMCEQNEDWEKWTKKNGEEKKNKIKITKTNNINCLQYKLFISFFFNQIARFAIDFSISIWSSAILSPFIHMKRSQLPIRNIYIQILEKRRRKNKKMIFDFFLAQTLLLTSAIC